MRVLVACGLVIGCGSSAPPSAAPEPGPAPAPMVAVDAAAPDAGNAGIPADLAAAPAWVFRYDAPGRRETWTLRHHGGQALVVVEGAQGTTRYLGSATEGATLVLSVMAGASGLALDCKRARQPIGATCGDRKAAPLDVLDCYHPDFEAPMTFAPAPGVEFVTTGGCSGYRRIAE